MTNFIRPIFQPFYNDFIRPMGLDSIQPMMHHIYHTLTEPMVRLSRGNLGYDNAVVEFEKLITNTLRIVRFVFTFFVYQAASKKSVHYFGHIGSGAAFVALYSLGNFVDPKSNYLSAASWLLYTGAWGLIKHGGSSTESLFCLFLISYKAYQSKEEKITSKIPGLEPLLQNAIKGVAHFLATLGGYPKPPPLIPVEQLPV